MANEKKYYWLKLQRDFFKRHDMRIIEEMENGKDYLLFYLKLLVESIDHDGKLRFSDTIPYNEKMLSVVTNTNVDIVRSALKIFSELKMIEVLEDETIYMTEVEKMIGSAADNDNAKRQHRFRERQKTALLEDSVTKSNAPVTDSVTNNNESKSIEKEIDKEIDKEKDIEVSSLHSDTSCGKPSKSAKPQAPKEPEEPAMITLILNDKSEYGVTQKMIDTYKECYPALDIMQELRSMKAWCLSNPTNRKTRNGIGRFINNWLSKSQNRGGGRTTNNSKTQQANDLIKQLQAEEENDEKK